MINCSLFPQTKEDKMVDRISKINPHDHLRVDASQDATEDEGREQQEEQDESPADGYSQLMDKTDWRLHLDQNASTQRKLTLTAGEIQEIRLVQINLKTNPSLVQLRLLLKDGHRIPTAYLSMPRAQALALQSVKPHSVLSVQALTGQNRITVFVAEQRSSADDEVTRVTADVENTFSQTIKMLIKKTWIQKIGVQDPDTKATNKEVALAYVTAAVVMASLVFGAFWLLF